MSERLAESVARPDAPWGFDGSGAAAGAPPASRSAGREPAPREAARVRARIEARRGWVAIDWKELWEARELLYFLTWRDIKVRYKQTVLGVAWVVLQPLLGMVVFTIIFGHLAKLPSDGLPYAVFVLAGLLPWTFFANAVTNGGQCLVNQQQLLTKIYLPRLLVPTACVGGSLIDFAIGFGIYALIMLVYGVVPGWGVVAVPFLILMTTVVALGFSLLLAALTVAYRDFRYVVPFMIQALMYLSPVVYPVSLVPPRYQWILALNPMAGLIDAYRSALTGRPWNVTTLSVSCLTGALLLVFGLYYFRRTERRFADIA